MFWFSNKKTNNNGGDTFDDISNDDDIIAYENLLASMKTSSFSSDDEISIELDETAIKHAIAAAATAAASSTTVHGDSDNARKVKTNASVVGVIDQGTSCTRFVLFTSLGQIAVLAQKEHEQIFPFSTSANITNNSKEDNRKKIGWHEHDPIEIWNNVVACINAVQTKLHNCGYILQKTGINKDDDHDHNNHQQDQQHQQEEKKHDDETNHSNEQQYTILSLECIGITNQRETTIAWNANTGIPYYNAIVWDDTRTSSIVTQIANGDINRIREQTGSPITNTCVGTKIKWLLDNIPQLQIDLQHHQNRYNVRFGTIDTWLIYQLTGTPSNHDNIDLENAKLTIDSPTNTTITIDNRISNNNTAGTLSSSSLHQQEFQQHHTAANIGGKFITDVTNASRWLFCNILHPPATHMTTSTSKAKCSTNTPIQWDVQLMNKICDPYSLPLTSLPTICKSSQVYAICNKSCGCDVLHNVPISSILGNQQATLFGLCAFEAGEATGTYSNGLSIMMNTGTKPILSSTHGLITTIAYQMDKNISRNDDNNNGEIHYALECNMSHPGSTLQWLNQIGILQSATEAETFARTTSNNNGLYFVPPFAGVVAASWRKKKKMTTRATTSSSSLSSSNNNNNNVRGCMVGITPKHHKGHICRAALEATVYQSKDIFDSIIGDLDYDNNNNKFPHEYILQSLKVDGIGTNNKLLMQFQADISNVPVIKPRILETTSLGSAFAAGLAVGIWKDTNEIRNLFKFAETYKPSMTEHDRKKYWIGWKRAVRKSLIRDDNDDTDDDYVDDDSTIVEDEIIIKEEEGEGKVLNKKDVKKGWNTFTKLDRDFGSNNNNNNNTCSSSSGKYDENDEQQRNMKKKTKKEIDTISSTTTGFSTTSVAFISLCSIMVGFMFARQTKR